MSENIKPTENNSFLVIILGIVAALLVFAVLTNRPVPLLNSDRAVMIALVVIGMAMCAVGGIGPAISHYGFASPIFIIGAALGILMLLIPGAVLVGAQLPLITGEREAIIALAVLGVVKVIVNIGYGLIVGRT